MTHTPNTLVRFITLPVMLLLLNACSSNGQEQSKLDTPEWTQFRTLMARYDSMTTAFEKMEKENPEFAKDPQAFLGEDLQKYYALIQQLQESVPKNIGEMTDFRGYSYEDLRTVKFGAIVAQQYAVFPGINEELLKNVKSPDSVRTLKLEIAQFALTSGDLAKGEKYASDDLLAGAEPLQRGSIESAFSQAYFDAKNSDRAREYALRAVKSFGEAQTTLPADDPQAAGQRQWILSRYAAVLAPLLHELKESGDATRMNALIADAKAQLPASVNWTDIQASVNESMAEIAKEREAFGKPAAKWQEHEWLGSSPLSIEGLKGKVVLIDFFATWCKPCIMAFPHIREWQNTYGDKGLVVIGLTTYQGRYEGSMVKPAEELVKLKDDFMKKHEITWPVGVEKNGRQTMLDYNVQGIPHVVLVDRAGKVQYVKVGAADYDKTERKIQQLLAE
ncbi:MAG: TlpA disulfide reductase family protein [Bacteroidota bacterium]|jgi:thiol-disulfide isomerase/thioredoxin|nr:TlpA disulfide reductase family protein [Bacteroidota bacterium]